MNRDEIIDLILNQNLTITDVIDAAIEINGIVGVGLVTLADQLKDYVIGKLHPHSEEEHD